MIPGEFITKQLSSVSSTEAKAWQPQIYGRDSCDTVADNTGHGLIATDYRKCSVSVG